MILSEAASALDMEAHLIVEGAGAQAHQQVVEELQYACALGQVPSMLHSGPARGLK